MAIGWTQVYIYSTTHHIEIFSLKYPVSDKLLYSTLFDVCMWSSLLLYNCLKSHTNFFTKSNNNKIYTPI